MDIRAIMEYIEGDLRRKYNREDANRTQRECYDEMGTKFAQMRDSIEENVHLIRQMEGLAEEARNSDLQENLSYLARSFSDLQDALDTCRRMAKNIAYD